MKDIDVFAIPDSMPNDAATAIPHMQPEEADEVLNSFSDDFEIVPIDSGAPTDTEQFQAMPEQPVAVTSAPDTGLENFRDSFDAAVAKEIENTETQPLATSSLVEPVGPIPEDAPVITHISGEKTVEELTKLTAAREKWDYLLQGAWQMSVTGSVLRGTFEMELDKNMEESLNFKDKMTRFALSMGPDLWLFGLGAAIPKIGSAALARLPQATRSLPIIQTLAKEAAPIEKSMASFGFFEGIRQMYMNKLKAQGEGDGKADFVELVGDVFISAIKGSATGAALGKGHQIRSSIMAASENALAGTAKATATLIPEASAIALLQSQLHTPGVLPTLEDFALAAGMIFGFESFGHVRRLVGSMKSGVVPPEVQQVMDYYVRNGVHPDTLTHDMLSNVSVMEDVSNVLNEGRIRIYEIDGGVKPEIHPMVDEVRKAYQEAKKPVMPEAEQPTGEAATGPEVLEAKPAPGTPTGAITAQQPIPLPKVPGIEFPMQLYAGEVVDIITLPDGRKVAVPTHPSRELAMSEHGKMDSAMAVILGSEILKGIKIRADSPETIKRNIGKDTVLGYFSPPELGSKLAEVELAKRIQSVNRAYNKAVRTNDATRESALAQELSALNEKMTEVQQEGLKSHRASVVISKILGQATPGAQLGTILHEIGHVLSYSVDQWNLGNSPGVSSLFFRTMSGYPHLMQSIMDFANANHLNYAQVEAEAKLLSRLWRPVSDAALSQNPEYANYRNAGAEIIADVVSVSLHRPDIIQQYAPSLHKAMEHFYEAHPEAKARVDGMNEMMRTGDEINAVIEAYKSSFATEEQMLRAKRDIDSVQLARRTTSGVSKMFGMMFDTFQPLWDAAKIPLRLQNMIQRYQFRATVKQGYISQLDNLVTKPLRKLGLTNEEIGILLQSRRIALDPDRANIFNTLATDPMKAAEAYDRLAARDPAQINALLSNFHEVRKATILKEYAKSGLYGDDFLETIMDNDVYARFSSLDHFEKWLEEGRYSLSENRGSQTYSTAEAEALKQTGMIGQIRNPLSATIELDLFMYDVLLRESALRGLIEHSVDTGDLPFIPAESFASVQKHTPALMKGYSAAEFKTITIPTRVLDPKTGKTITVRKAWKAPADILEPFTGKPSEVQAFISDLARYSFGKLAKETLTSPNKDRGMWAFKSGVKGITNVNDSFRFLTIVIGASFQVANFFSYDPLRTLHHLPTPEGEIGLQKVTVFKHYPEALYDLLKQGLTGNVSPKMQSLLDRGILSTRQRFVEDFGNTDLSERLLHEYGSTGFMSNVQWKGLNFLNAVPRTIGELLQVTLNATDNTAKYAADSWMTEKANQGKLNLMPGEQDVILREQIGSPAYSIKGSASSLGNAIFPFMTSISMALRGDYRAFKRNPTSWAMGAATYMIPTIIQGLMLNGFFDGDEPQDGLDSVIDATVPRVSAPPPSLIMRTQTSRTHNSNWTFPAGIDPKTGEGTTFNVPIPQNPALRLMHVTTLALINAIAEGLRDDPEDKELRTVADQLIGVATSTMRSVVDTGGSATPSFTPALSIPVDAYRILTQGNTFDDFTMRMKYYKDIPEGEERLEAAAKSVMENLGVPKEIRNLDDFGGALRALVNPTPEETERTLTSRLVDAGVTAPFVGGGWNRIIKKGNQGLAERNAKELKEKARISALKANSLDKDFEAILAGEDVELDSLKHPERGPISRAMILAHRRKWARKEIGKDNKYLQNILESGTNASIDAARQMAPYSPEAREAVEFAESRRKK